jgi:hypothetical protein
MGGEKPRSLVHLTALTSTLAFETLREIATGVASEQDGDFVIASGLLVHGPAQSHYPWCREQVAVIGGEQRTLPVPG